MLHGKIIFSHALITEQEVERRKMQKKKERVFPPQVGKDINFSLYPISNPMKNIKVYSRTILPTRVCSQPIFPSVDMSIVSHSMGIMSFIQ